VLRIAVVACYPGDLVRMCRPPMRRAFGRFAPPSTSSGPMWCFSGTNSARTAELLKILEGVLVVGWRRIAF